MTKQWEAKRRRPRRGAAVSSIKVEAPGIERDEVATTKLAVLLVFPRLRASSRHFPASWSSTGVHTGPRESDLVLGGILEAAGPLGLKPRRSRVDERIGLPGAGRRCVRSEPCPPCSDVMDG